jgi:hypothetical protein
MHFALIDQGVLVAVNVLNRILNGQDVGVALGVDAIEHRGQGGRLAAARRPGHQYETTWALEQRSQD